MSRINLTSPVGRIVMGSLYNPNTKDADGKPLVTQSGEARVQYFFALAIPKGTEAHWNQTPWGAQIYQAGKEAFKAIADSPAFSWKIEDGDSQIPNTKGRKPCDTDGFKGNWVIKFSSGYAPTLYKQEGSSYVQLTQEGFIKNGYYVEVAFSVTPNGQTLKPGMFVSPTMVCFRAYGDEIVSGPDVSSAGFGQSPLPAGASATPLAGYTPMPATPNYAILNPQPIIASHVTQTPVASAPITPPPVSPVYRMTPAAMGVSYEDYQKAGWSDIQLIQAGLMLA